MRSVVLGGAVLALVASAASAAEPPVDRAFVAKVSQGGMFEVEASKVATANATAQDVKDFAVAEVHDHKLVGDRLKTVASAHSIVFAPNLNAEFQARLDRLKGLTGAAFDMTYMTEMADIHAKDGAAFAKEAASGGTPDFRAFARETHTIVLRHIGAIHAAPPPAG